MWLSLTSSVFAFDVQESTDSCSSINEESASSPTIHLITQEHFDNVTKTPIRNEVVKWVADRLFPLLEKHIGSKFSGEEWIRAVHNGYADMLSRFPPESEAFRKIKAYLGSEFSRSYLTGMALWFIPDDEDAYLNTSFYEFRYCNF